MQKTAKGLSKMQSVMHVLTSFSSPLQMKTASSSLGTATFQQSNYTMHTPYHIWGGLGLNNHAMEAEENSPIHVVCSLKNHLIPYASHLWLNHKA